MRDAAFRLQIKNLNNMDVRNFAHSIAFNEGLYNCMCKYYNFRLLLLLYTVCMYVYVNELVYQL